MAKKKHLIHEDMRIERINVDGIVIKDKFTRKPIVTIPKGLNKLI